MLVAALELVNLLLACGVVGTMFGVWLICNPGGLDAVAYAAQHRRAILALNKTMPILGGILVILTSASAVTVHAVRAQAGALALAALCFAIAGLITRLRNQPLNAVVMSWPVGSPAANWTEVRDDWWLWHAWRTVFAMVGLSMVTAAIGLRALPA